MREPRLLAATSGELVASMVALVAAFPARNVQLMVEARPGLLLMAVGARGEAGRAGAMDGWRAHQELS
jgi:hypothetical protein